MHGHVPTAGHVGGPGVYLTDEVFLYRLAGFMTRGVAGLVELEDCYALDVVQVPLSALRARGLRIVTPAAGDFELSHRRARRSELGNPVEKSGPLVSGPG
jgi:hypothetical protein